MRAKGTAVTSSASWISNFFIAQVTPPAFTAIGWKYYLVFAICGHTNALFIWAFYPETTGRRLEEMDALFTDAPLFVPGTQYAKVEDYRAAERELRNGTFVPGHLTEEGGNVQDDEEGKFSGAGEMKHIESTEKI